MKAYNDLRAEYEKKIEEHIRAIESLRSELAGADKLYRLSQGLPEPSAAGKVLAQSAIVPKADVAQRKVKKYVLDTVISCAEKGVNAAEIIAQGLKEGRELKASSVSSLLSRLKREGTLRFVGDRYYPVKSDAQSAVVTPIRPVEAA